MSRIEEISAMWEHHMLRDSTTDADTLVDIADGYMKYLLAIARAAVPALPYLESDYDADPHPELAVVRDELRNAIEEWSLSAPCRPGAIWREEIER